MDLSRERILKNVDTEEFYQELFSACAEGDLCEVVIHSKDINNATKEFVDFVENSDISLEAKIMFIDGFKSSVEAEYLRAFEEEKAMLDTLDIKNFPKDGTIELATQKLVEAIAENKLNEKEIEFVSKEFRYCEPLNKYDKQYGYGAPRYGVPVKLSTSAFTREELEQGIRTGLEKDNDLLLDMKYSGQLVPIPHRIYTNDTNLINEVAENNYQELLHGALPSDVGSLGSDAQLFYHNLLGNELYNSDKFAELRDIGDDIDEATKEFFSVINNEEPSIKEDILEKFKSAVEKDAWDDEPLWDMILEGQQENATEILNSKGFLKESETYLMLGSNINWRNSSGYSLKKVEDLDDMINGVVPDADYTIDITAKENTPYFEAMVYSHDVPTGSHCYFLPESQWDALIGFDKETKTFNQGYEFIKDFMKKDYIGESIKKIFHAKRKEIEMDLEAEKDSTIAEIKEIYDQYIYDSYYNDTIEKFEDNGIAGAWDEVCEHLVEKLEDEAQNVDGYMDNPLILLRQSQYEKLLTKFNPTLQSSEVIVNRFKKNFESELNYQYNIDIENKCNLERGYNYLNFLNRDLPISEIENKFMKDIVETHGTGLKTIQEGIDIITKRDNLLPHESAKLFNKTLNSEEYKKAFDKEQNQSRDNAR